MNFLKRVIFGNKIENLLKLGSEHLDDENYYSAIALFSQVLDINHNCEEALFSRASAYLTCNNYEKANQDLLHLEEINPDYDPNIYYLLSKLSLAMNNTKTAVYYSDKSCSKYNDNIQYQYFSAKTKYLNGDYEEALALVNLLIQNNEQNFDLRYLKALILHSQENYISAILEIDKAIEINSLCGFTFNLRGLVNIQLENTQEAIDDFDYAIRLDPINSIYYFNKAKLQFKLGDAFDADDSISYAIELNSEDKTFHILKAEVKLALDNRVEALISYNTALKLDPSNKELLKRIAKLRISICDYEGAKEDLICVNEIDDNDNDARFIGAYVDQKLGNIDKALNALEETIKIKKSANVEIFEKAKLEFNSENYSRSIELFDTIVATNGSSQEIIINKVRALIRIGNISEAKAALEDLDSKISKEYFVLRSQINYLDKEYALSSADLEKISCKDLEIETIRDIKNVLYLLSKNVQKIEEMKEFENSKGDSSISQMLNGILNFEKGQYYSAKYRLSNLTEDKLEILKPLIDYTESQITT